MCYKPDVNYTYWPVLGSFNNWNINTSTNKTTSSKDFDAVNKVVIGGISNNMSSLIQLGKYGAIDSVNPTTMGYYVINYLSKPYTL